MTLEEAVGLLNGYQHRNACDWAITVGRAVRSERANAYLWASEAGMIAESLIRNATQTDGSIDSLRVNAVRTDAVDKLALHVEAIAKANNGTLDVIREHVAHAIARLSEIEAHVGSIDGCNASINRQLDKHLARIYAVEQAIEKAPDRLGTTTEIAVLTNRINQCHRERCEDYADHRKRLGEAFEGIESLSAAVAAGKPETIQALHQLDARLKAIEPVDFVNTPAHEIAARPEQPKKFLVCPGCRRSYVAECFKAVH